jgi:two-component system nitrate/nitrite response regulator NarL
MLVILGNLPADEAVTTAASIRIQWPTAKVAYLFDYLSSADYQNLLASEINGCVPLHASSATLLHLLRQLIDTDHFRVMIMRADASSTARAPTVQPSLEADLSQEDDTVHRVSARRTSWGLSGREDEILRFLAQGQSNKVIARACGVADATIKVHMKSIFRKLGVGNRTQAALRAMEWAADKAVDLVPAYSDPPIVEMA